MAADGGIGPVTLQQDLRIAQDAVQRGAQFMAHVGQEHALGAALLFGNLAPLVQRLELLAPETQHQPHRQAQQQKGEAAHVIDEPQMGPDKGPVGDGGDVPVGLGDGRERCEHALPVDGGVQPPGLLREHLVDQGLQAGVRVLQQRDRLGVDVAAALGVGVGNRDAGGVHGKGVALRAVGEAGQLLHDGARVDHAAEDADDVGALGVAAEDRAGDGHDVGVERTRVDGVGGIDPALHGGLEVRAVAEVLALGEINLGVVVRAVRVDVGKDVEPRHLLVLGLEEGARFLPIHRADDRRVRQRGNLGLAGEQPAVHAVRHTVGLLLQDGDLLVHQLGADAGKAQVAQHANDGEEREQGDVEPKIDALVLTLHQVPLGLVRAW